MFSGTKMMTMGAWRVAARNFQQQSSQTVRQTARQYSNQARSSSAVPGLTNSQVMARAAVGVGAAAGVLGVCTMGEATADKAAQWQPYVQQRVSSTYGYFAGGLGVTAVSAYALYTTGALHRVMMSHPIAFSIGGFVATIGAMVATQSISYHENKTAKLAAMGLFNAAIGATLAPVGFIGGPIIMRAAMYTGAVVGTLSLAAMAAKSDQFLSLGGPLTMGLGIIVISSFGRLFMPAHWFVATTIMDNVVLYGGTIVFSGFVLYDTQKIVQKAKFQRDFDPVNASLGIYLDTINLFRLMITFLSNRKK